MYAAGKTRMDLQQAVSMAARVLSNPGKQHWDNLVQTPRYAWHTRTRKLVFRGRHHAPGRALKVEAGVGRAQEHSLVGYTDSDWAGSEGRKSTSGLIITLGGNLVDWRSKLQATVAKSSCAAGLIAASLCATHVAQLRGLLSELGFKLDGPTSLIMCDNQGAIVGANNPITSPRMRYLDIADRWVKGQVARGRLWLHYINTKDNDSDLLSKPTSRATFERHISKYYPLVPG